MRVLIADDMLLFAGQLAQICHREPSVQLIAQAREGNHALHIIRSEQPDIALVDLDLPGMDGIALLTVVIRERLPTAIMLLASRICAKTLHLAVARQARAVVSKEAEEQEIADAIGAVAQGHVPISWPLATAVDEEVRRRASQPRFDDITLQILEMLAEGKRPREIANAIHIAHATVKARLQSVYKHFEVHGATPAAVEAVRRGVID